MNPVILSVAVLLAAPLATPASAQVVFTPDAVLACLQTGGGAACAGASVEACRNASPGGQSNAGGSGCLDAEYRWWEAQMDFVLRQLRAARQSEAADMRARGMQDFGTPAALEALQAGWLAWRSASCDYEVTLWQGGSGGGAAGADCLLRMTAQQALKLDEYLREARQ